MTKRKKETKKETNKDLSGIQFYYFKPVQKQVPVKAVINF